MFIIYFSGTNNSTANNISYTRHIQDRSQTHGDDVNDEHDTTFNENTDPETSTSTAKKSADIDMTSSPSLSSVNGQTVQLPQATSYLTPAQWLKYSAAVTLENGGEKHFWYVVSKLFFI